MNWSDPSLWRSIATLFFFLFFCGAALWAFCSRRSRNFQHDAALPLDDGQPAHRQGHCHE